MLSKGLCVQLACIWEATARKPGNVHCGRDFDDLGYLDFLLSAAAVAPILETAQQRSVGETIRHAVEATRRVVRTNTNLGIVLLLAPLAAAPDSGDLRHKVEQILQSLTQQDAAEVYQAIRLANPGGMGQAPEQDVREEPTQTLREVMALAADRDLIARQYANGFRQVFEDGVPALRQGLELVGSLETAIIRCHLHLMALHPDSLIARKRGPAEAEEAARRARQVLEAGWPERAVGQYQLADLDAWLCDRGHTRNPGTTADLVTACLFVLLRQGNISLPVQIPWSV
jgi:triphosphoribosyl-dephospho-CoA synthase